MKHKTHSFNCKVCNTNDSVDMLINETNTHVEVKVYKCINCKHQYGIKELCQN